MTTPLSPPLTADDPRLTAYALGECEAAEAAAIAEAIAADPTLADELEAIRATTTELGHHFAQAPNAALDELARARIHRAASRPRRRLIWWSGPLLAAAALVLAVLWFQPEAIPMRSGEQLDSSIAWHRDPAQPPGPAQGRALTESDVTIRSEVEVEYPVALELGVSPAAMAGENEATAWTRSDRGREEALRQTDISGSGAFLALGASPQSAPPPTRTWGSIGDEILPSPPQLPPQPQGSEDYQPLGKNPFTSTAIPGGDASTFAIDVDTASYTLVRRMLLRERRLPPPDAVRIEEFINYFRYAYTPPSDNAPFAVSAETVAAPWQPEHRLVRIGIQGKAVSHAERPPANLVFLIDTSGSMRPDDRLPLAQRAFPHLVSALDERDTVTIVTYAGSVGIALGPTSGAHKAPILNTIAGLRASGGTAGGAGLALAYRSAAERFIEGGINRVILVTDGDFNVGVTDHGSLVETVRHYASQGIRITVLGVGTGNLHDHRIEQISNRGNGVYRYLDSDREAQRVFTEGLLGDLVTIASDVKTQVFFNPAQVAGWRLIGYQNRVLKREDFNDDSVDAGDIGAGHQVTALYEIIPAGLPVPGASQADPNPFVRSDGVPEGRDGPMLRLRLRHKHPDGGASALQEFNLADRGRSWEEASPDTQWAAAVAAFGMALRGEESVGHWQWSDIREVAEASGLAKADAQRGEFLSLIDAAAALGPRPAPSSQPIPDREPATNELQPMR